MAPRDRKAPADPSAGFWGYKAPAPAPGAPVELDMTREQWQSLSPGMRREITRSYQKPKEEAK